MKTSEATFLGDTDVLAKFDSLRSVCVVSCVVLLMPLWTLEVVTPACFQMLAQAFFDVQLYFIGPMLMIRIT